MIGEAQAIDSWLFANLENRPQFKFMKNDYNFSSFFFACSGPLSIGGGYQEHEDVDDDDDDDDENAIIDVEDYKMPPISITSPIPSSHHSGSNGTSNNNSNNNNNSNHHASSTSIITTKNRIGRPTKSSLSSPVSSSTASDDERLSPDSVKVSQQRFYSFARPNNTVYIIIYASELRTASACGRRQNEFQFRLSDNNNYIISRLRLRFLSVFSSRLIFWLFYPRVNGKISPFFLFSPCKPRSRSLINVFSFSFFFLLFHSTNMLVLIVS